MLMEQIATVTPRDFFEMIYIFFLTMTIHVLYSIVGLY